MHSWGIFIIAFSAVIVQAWVRGRGTPNWYMDCIIPLLYGAAVAWMFMGEGLLRFLQIILFGTAIPITLFLSAWMRKREDRRPGDDGAPRAE